MNILLIGYGYLSKHLLKILTAENHKVWVISRSARPEELLPPVQYLQGSATSAVIPNEHFNLAFYTIPPSDVNDSVLQKFLEQLQDRADTLVYCGASSVYGDYQGQWVQEESPCKAKTPRELYRLHAEQLCLNWAKAKNRRSLILRVAGIYGPGRLPIEAALAQQPLIHPDEAPWSNLISIYDLAYIAYYLGLHGTKSEVFNIADGTPLPMGSLQAEVAEQLGVPPAPYESFAQLYAEASPKRRDFMQSSKRLCIAKLQQALPKEYTLLELPEGVARALREEEKS